jgi:hypothetical protein
MMMMYIWMLNLMNPFLKIIVESASDNGLFHNNSETESEEDFLQDSPHENLDNSETESEEELLQDSPHENLENKTLAEELMMFFLMFNLPRTAMTTLLLILIKHGISGVPKSVYLLKKSVPQQQHNTPIINMSSGEFAYIGIINYLENILTKGLVNLNANGQFLFNIKINIDGLPLFKSSRLTLWPILIQLSNCSRVVPIALFCGTGKPDLLVYCQQLIDEIRSLKTGIIIKNIFVKLGTVVVIADTPARTYLQCIKGHTSYVGCSWCRQNGSYEHNRICFQSIRCQPRTDYSYNNVSENNQIQVSPFLNIIPMYSCFPVDFMHAVCIGVVKKIMNFYFTKLKGFHLSCTLLPRQVEVINTIILYIRKYFCSEFQRKPRIIHDLAYFKATEFRMFLLYVGPLVLKNVLTDVYYNFFIQLHFAMYVFSSPRYCSAYFTEASTCLDTFVTDFPDLFHESLLSFNVHALLHIPEFVKMYGTVDNFSCFPFENFLHTLKKRIRCNNSIMKQAMNHMYAIINIQTTVHHHNQKELPLNYSITSPDNCAITSDGQVVLITSFHDNRFTGKVLHYERDLYSHPYPSKLLQIGYYSTSRKIITNFQPVNKAICIPFKKEYLIFPFCM